VPETLIGSDPDRYVRHIIEQWGGAEIIEGDVVEEYIRCQRRPEVLRAMGAEYRADRIDLQHDSDNRIGAHRITCPLLAIWAQGGLTEQFGDPLAIWRNWADRVVGTALAGGHFLMEGSPQEVTALIRAFLTLSPSLTRPADEHHAQVGKQAAVQVDRQQLNRR
jgi:haloacetate dehalogenase